MLRQLVEKLSLTGEVDTIKEIVIDAIREGYAGAIDNLTEEFLESSIKYCLHNKLTSYGEQLFSNFALEFDNMRGAGEANGHTLTLNEQLIARLSLGILKVIQHRGLPTDDPGIIDEVLKYTGMRTLIATIVSVVLHEMVHIKQNDVQYKKYGDTKQSEYRSYLTKNNEEFYKAVERLETAYDHKLYKASPQEIEAYSHEVAYTIIQSVIGFVVGENELKKVVDFTSREIDEIIKLMNDCLYDPEWRKYVTSYYKAFTDSEHKADQRVLNRFLKKVYQELESYKQKLLDMKSKKE